MASEQTPMQNLQTCANATDNKEEYFDWSKNYSCAGIETLPNSGTPATINEQQISDCSESDDNEAKEYRPGLSKKSGVWKKSHQKQNITKSLQLSRNIRSLNKSMRTALSPRKVSKQQDQFELNQSVEEATIVCPSTPPRRFISEYTIDSTSPAAPIRKKTDNLEKASELDLLVELIERHNEPTPSTSKKLKRKKAKRCDKHGYVAQFRRTLLKARMDQRFLDNERRLGIAAGIELLVTSVSESFGVHIANVVLADSVQADLLPSFSVILNANISKQVTVGSRLEAFFDELPVKFDGETIFVQPHKLFLK